MICRWLFLTILLQMIGEMNAGGPILPEFRADAQAMVARRSIDDSVLRLVNDANASQRPAPPLNPRQILSGPNTLTLTVLDDKTLRPVAGGVVHGVIVVHAARRGSANQTSDISLGRLESKRTGAAGTCRYEGLGWLDVQFEVRAKGYLPKTQRVGIPGAGGGAIVRLTPGATVKGRFIDDATGAPLENIRIEIFRNGNNSAYHDDSNEAGAFAIDGLPAGRYRVTFPALENRVQQNMDSAHFHARVAGAKDGKLDPEAYQNALANALAEPQWLVPRHDPIDLQGSGETDLGTIRLQKTPVLELQVTYEGAAPLSHFPFQVSYYEGLRDVGGTGFKTDGDGRARLALAGWRPGQTVAVFLPSLDAVANQPRRLFGRLADPQAALGEKEWYELLDVYGYSPRTLTGGKPSNGPFNEEGILTNTDPNEAMNQAVPAAPFDTLTPEQHAAFHSNLETNRQEYEALRLHRAEIPDHPNYDFFTPAPGEVHTLRMSYKPAAGELDLILNVRDQRTKAPLARFTGVFCERADFLDSTLAGNNTAMDMMLSSSSGNRRTFRAIDATGQVLLPAVRLSEEFLKRERQVKENRAEPNGPPLEALKKLATTGILIDAPGYVRRIFTFRADELRATKELTLELEPAASVRGRVVLAGSGEPLTSATLREVLRRAGRWTDGMENGGDALMLKAAAELNQEAPEAPPAEKPGAAPAKQDTHYPRQLRAAIGAGGRFELEGLRTNAPWSLTIETPALPRFKRDGMTLQPGLNDLGIIEVGTAGWLAGRITDERGAPLRGVAIEFPAARLFRDSRQTTATGSAGDYRVSLLPLHDDRQLVRLVPPWGADTPSTLTRGLRVNIAWDTLKTLDRCASNTLDAALPHGQRLRIEIPRTPPRDTLERLLADPRSYQLAGLEPVAPKTQPYFAIRSVLVQGLTPGPEGRTYSQFAWIRDGLRLTTGTFAVELDHVPPGRHAVVVEGTLLDTKGNRHDGAVELVPLASGEVEMKETSATLTLHPSLASVELSLADPSAAAMQDRRPGTYAFFDREGTRSSLMGAFAWREAQRTFYGEVTDPEACFTPLLGYLTVFTHPGPEGKPAGYRPALLRAVPPGRWRLRVFYDIEKLKSWPPRADYETTVEVPDRAETLRVRIP